MLDFLRIRNLALIEDMELEFAPGMNVLTGETGAGKSFILKALGFLLGDRLQADMVRPGAEKAQVEALFSMDDTDIILRRELAASTGRSRLYINDSLSSQESLRDLRAKLVSHTSQHAQHQLLQPGFQARLMETLFPHPELLQERDTLLSRLQTVARERETLEQRRAALLERRELLEVQQAEIDKVAPQADEEEKLEALREQARSHQRMCVNYENALNLLYGEEGMGLLDLLGRFERLLRDMCHDDPGLMADTDAVTALRQQLSHLAGLLRRPPLADDPVDLDKLESRLFAIAQLKRKLHREIAEILALRDEIEQNLSFLDACALDISRLEKEEQSLTRHLQELLVKMAPLRHAAAEDFARALEGELRQLAFSEQVRVIPEYLTHEIWPGIIDEKIRILWAPNPGQSPQPLDKIASGGELSRFLLALTSVRPDAESATYIFDEVDSGVGGLTLNKLAEKLAVLASRRQMLLITHWPQLAARADKHFHIRKLVHNNATFTQCTPLDAPARQAELARMAGGGAQGEALARSLG